MLQYNEIFLYNYREQHVFILAKLFRYPLIFSVIFSQVFADDWTPKSPEEIKAISTTCMTESSVTEEQKKEMYNFNFPDDEAVHKYILCHSEKMGIFCPHEGKFNTDRVAKQFKIHTDESEAKKIADECVSEHPKGDKENEIHAFEMHNCIMESEIGKHIKDWVKEHRKKDEDKSEEKSEEEHKE